MPKKKRKAETASIGEGTDGIEERPTREAGDPSLQSTERLAGQDDAGMRDVETITENTANSKQTGRWSDQDLDAAFDEAYIRQLTEEFAEDLEKARHSKDFTESSVQMIVETFRECGRTHTQEEKRQMLGWSR